MARLALPAVMVQLALMAMGTVDLMMVGHMDGAASKELGGVALGHIYFQTVKLAIMGVFIALDPLVSQAVGANDRPAIARALQRGVVLLCLLAPPTLFLLNCAGPVFRWTGQRTDIIEVAVGYIRANMLGVPAFFAFVIMRTTLQAMGRITPTLLTALFANGVNAGMNWLLIYGNGGFPALGARGSGISTSIACVFMATCLFAIARKELLPHLRPFRSEAFDRAALMRIIKLGAPIGGQFLLEMGIFSLVGFLMGVFDAKAADAASVGMNLAGHQITLNLASLTFMVPLGISIAASVRVGQAVGAENPDGARRTAKFSLIAGAAAMAGLGLIMRFLPMQLAAPFSKDAAVVLCAATLIPIAGVFQIFDGLQVVSVGILRGIGDTRAVLGINVFGFWVIALPCAVFFAADAAHPIGPVHRGLGMGPAGLWWGLVVGLMTVAVMLVVRVRKRFAGELRRIEGSTPGAMH